MIPDVIRKIINGDIRLCVQLIRDIDDEIPGVREILKKLYNYTGKTYVIGITGAPGVGKSTLIDKMVSYLRRKHKSVGVLAIDPTSPFTGGAILGDRIRMQRHNLDEGVFVHSMATRGHFGGLTRATQGAIMVMDAMGKDYVLVETVGVGQDEVEIVKKAKTTIVVVVPGMGDDVQALKAGILEAGDLFVINKADREGVEKTYAELNSILDLEKKRNDESGWRYPVLKVEANIGKGITELMNEIDNHRSYLMEMIDQDHQMATIRDELKEMIRTVLIERFFDQITTSNDFEKAVELVFKGHLDPYTACDNLIDNVESLLLKPKI